MNQEVIITPDEPTLIHPDADTASAVAEEAATAPLETEADGATQAEEAASEKTGIASDRPDTQGAPAVKTVDVVAVSFRSSSKSYYFSPCPEELKNGDGVIVETARGKEYGKVTCAVRTVRESDLTAPLKPILRRATEDDTARYLRNRELERDAAKIFPQKVAQHKLDMRLVDVEYTFDNTKLTFYFTSETRVDFRELIRDLASIFRTRIDLRQIGIRDEARMIGGLGSCGRPFCCSTFLTNFSQVSIKMAKEQNFSLSSSKISGACGRLMCCLRYEHEEYEEAQKTTPNMGALVDTPDGRGTVVETRPLAQTVKVRLQDKPDSVRLYACPDVTVLNRAAVRREEQERAAAEAARPTAPQENKRSENTRPRQVKRAKPGQRVSSYEESLAQGTSATAPGKQKKDK